MKAVCPRVSKGAAPSSILRGQVAGKASWKRRPSSLRDTGQSVWGSDGEVTGGWIVAWRGVGVSSQVGKEYHLQVRGLTF